MMSYGSVKMNRKEDTYRKKKERRNFTHKLWFDDDGYAI